MLVNSPLNHKYISQSTLKKSLLGAVPYASGRLLDVGCGEKQYAAMFGGHVEQYIGVDLPTCYFEGRKVDVFGDAHHLPFRAGSFETILCTQVLCHIKDPKQASREFKRALKDSCYAIVTAPKSYPKMMYGPDYFRFTDDGLRYLAEDTGRGVVYIKPTCNMLATIGQYLSRCLCGNILADKKTGNAKPWLVPLILPSCAVTQWIFVTLGKISFLDDWEKDTLDYIIVVKKEP